jgi:CubicO group peptidase (beta-lactamase class C family)
MKCRILRACLAVAAAALLFVSCNESQDLPRKKPSKVLEKAAAEYIQKVQDEEQGIHSIMIVKNGKVVFEKWMGEGEKNTPHILHSVSKTFTATAVGMAIDAGLISLEDKVIDFFPEYLPETVSDNLASLNVKHLLTMNCGFETSPDSKVRPERQDWVRAFLEQPIDREPGTIFCYTSLATYMLSAIVQKVTGEKLVDYLQPRLFQPLGITDVHWDESPEGINTGGWGLYLKTEDLAKLGQLLLQQGMWKGQQLVSKEWVAQATSRQVASVPAGKNTDMLEQVIAENKQPDWVEGYCFQMWRCTHNAFRADGAYGQIILIMPEKDAVIAVTAENYNFQAELNAIWDHLYPAL